MSTISQTPAPPRRVFIFRFSSLGDIILTTPAVEALKTAWPDTRLIFCLKAGFETLVAHNPHIDEVIALGADEATRSFRQRLNLSADDAILDLHGKLRSKLIRWLSPVKHSSVWHKRPWQDNLPVRLGLRPYKPTMTIADRYHAAVEALVGHSLERGHLRCFPAPGADAVITSILSKAGLDLERPFIGMSPGAKWDTKRWPESRYAELAQRALDAGMQVILTGSPDEKTLGRIIGEHTTGIVDLIGEVPLDALSCLIGRCTAFVANDSGPMHIARAMGVPTLTFFGSTSPRQFEFEGHQLMYAQSPCSPCHFYGRATCPRGHFSCMLDLDVEQSWQRLQTLLDGNPRAWVHG